jgi:TonB family protein
VFKRSGSIAAVAAASIVLSSGICAQAAVTSGSALQSCRAETPTVLRRVLPKTVAASPSTFAVVRMTLRSDGLIGTKRLVWNSGNAAFNDAALAAASRTAFAPASHACVAGASEFDYLFATSPTKRVSAVVVPKVGM